jgi:pimeloyl-ACP methyl ester carboxylesterase
MATKPVFVLVHGAWHGGWCWVKVRQRLRREGYRVFTPTQTGLGQRCHLMSDSIDLNVFVDDIANVIRFEQLENVVLVGHSFAGTSISGVANRLPDRLKRLVYLDSLIVKSGETPLSRAPAHVIAERIKAAQVFSSGVSLPPPSPEAFGVTDPEQAAWLTRRLTPHPMKAYQSTLELEPDITNGVPATYIVCTDPLYAPLASSRERAREMGWDIAELATGHDAMVSAPDETAELLLSLV